MTQYQREFFDNPKRPRVVCLIGSTRFRAEFEEKFRELEHAGCIVLTVPCFKDDPCCKTEAEQKALDQLHFHKLTLCDEVFCINPGGYVGSSTRTELMLVMSMGLPINYTEVPDFEKE